jgi:hypothetical protein
MAQPFRLQPALPVTAYKTYQVLMPKSTHTRPARCEEVECAAHQRGWVTRVDVTTELGQAQARYIRNQAGRAFTTAQLPGNIVAFQFPAGQQCFAEHRVSLERPALYVVRDGDWRGNPTGRRMQHASDRDWVDDFGEHQLNLKDRIERG